MYAAIIVAKAASISMVSLAFRNCRPITRPRSKIGTTTAGSLKRFQVPCTKVAMAHFGLIRGAQVKKRANLILTLHVAIGFMGLCVLGALGFRALAWRSTIAPIDAPTSTARLNTGSRVT